MSALPSIRPCPLPSKEKRCSPVSGDLTHGSLGVRFDAATGLHYMRQRWYSSELQRFISRDPIGLGGGNNVYAYVDNAPMNWTDSHGLEPMPSPAPGPSPAPEPIDPESKLPDPDDDFKKRLRNFRDFRTCRETVEVEYKERIRKTKVVTALIFQYMTVGMGPEMLPDKYGDHCPQNCTTVCERMAIALKIPQIYAYCAHLCLAGGVAISYYYYKRETEDAYEEYLRRTKLCVRWFGDENRIWDYRDFRR